MSLPPLTISDLHKEENGLLQQIRTHVMKLFDAGKLDFVTEWRTSKRNQNVSEEADILLRSEIWRVWTKDYTPPRNFCLRMVRAVLEQWAARA